MIANDGRVTAFPGSESGRLRLAIPNKGRMQGPSLQLLHDAGLRFEDGTRALTAKVEGFPLDILFVRTDDIVEFVADGVADLGITGTNLLIEAGAELETLVELGYGYCRLEAAVPNESPARSLEDLGRHAPGHQPPPRDRDVLRQAGHRGRDRDHLGRGGGGAHDGPRRRRRRPRLEWLDADHERPALGGPAASPARPSSWAARTSPRKPPRSWPRCAR